MGEKIVDIEKRYSREINDIKYILTCLENNRIYELTGAKGDGSLYTNVSNLRRELNDLLDKVQYGKKSISEQLRDAMSIKKKDQ